MAPVPPSRRTVLRGAGSAASLGITALVLPTAASASTIGQVLDVSLTSGETFTAPSATASTTTWTVPAEVTFIQVVARGTDGGAATEFPDFADDPGRGGLVVASFDVTPGEVLRIAFSSTRSGVDGSGAGGQAVALFGPTGGDMWCCAGGGGGAGAGGETFGNIKTSDPDHPRGGGGGDAGATGGTGEDGGTGGGGGGESASGAGGTGSANGSSGAGYSAVGPSLGAGGSGGNSANGGGAGGAGRFGGGGGGSSGFLGGGGGGGGGSSYVDGSRRATGTGVLTTVESRPWAARAQLTISY